MWVLYNNWIAAAKIQISTPFSFIFLFFWGYKPQTTPILWYTTCIFDHPQNTQTIQNQDDLSAKLKQYSDSCKTKILVPLCSQSHNNNQLLSEPWCGSQCPQLAYYYFIIPKRTTALLLLYYLNSSISVRLPAATSKTTRPTYNHRPTPTLPCETRCLSTGCLLR